MKNIDTRKRALITSGILCVIYLLFWGFEVFYVQQISSPIIDYVFSGITFPLLAFIIMFIGVAWILNYKMKGEKIITLGMFGAIPTFVLSMGLQILVIDSSTNSAINWFMPTLLIFYGVNYSVLLNVNILNYSYQNNIPLGQAARASSYIFTLLVMFFVFFLLFSTSITKILSYSLSFMLTFFFVYSLLWNLKLEYKKLIFSSLGISLTVLLILFVLGMWPVSPAIIAFSLSIVLYVLIGIALEEKEKINRYIWIEYGTLVFLIVMILIFFANWGINGHLI